MNPWYPKILAQGLGGTITTEGGMVIGKLGEWRINTYGDDRPYFTARGCEIARIWLSAGVVRVVCRPTRPAGASIAGEVKLIDADRLNLGELTFDGILKGADSGEE